MPTGNLPSEGKKLWEEVYNKALKGSCKGDKGCAAGSAWKAVHNAGWKKDAQGNWHKSEVFSEFSMRIDRASYDKATGERRVRIVASDTDEDNRKDSMSLELFNDFIDRIKKNEPVPEEFQSDFWKGGEPYISVSHYPDANGKTVPGVIDATYIDGNYLKSKGKFNDTPLGRKCFETVCSDLYGETKDRPDKVRISIAFLDYMHKHKSNGFVFDRQNSKVPFCPECMMEIANGETQGKIFMKGHLIHEALTRVPVNTRTGMEVEKSMADKVLTRKDDASSIVGEELANELEEQAEVIGKSEALVIKSDEKVEEALEEVPGEAEEDCTDPITGEVDPDCTAKKVGEADMAGTPVTAEAELVEEATKKEGPANYPSSDYLVVEDPDKPSTWHLQVKKHGKPDHGLMGAAKAALTSPGGHRGNKYQGPNKSEAISKLKALYAREKMPWKSEIEESESYEEIKNLIVETVRSVMEETKITPETIPAHPLDAIFTEFKSKFDEIVKSDASEAEKLQQVQEPFNSLGTGIVSVVKSSVKPKEVTPEVQAQSDLVAALSQALNPLTQKLDLLVTQLSTPPIEKAMPQIPQRRSIPPSVAMRPPQQPINKSETPKLHELISKTV